MTMIESYDDCEAWLVNPRTKRPVPRKKIANNTYVERGGHVTERGDQVGAGEIGVVLHETAVVVYARRYIRLNSGGWLTTTTCDRINRFTPDSIRVFSVSGKGGPRWHVTWGARGMFSTPFYDGITLQWSPEAEFDPMNPTVARGGWMPTAVIDTTDEDAHNAMVRQMVRGYLRRLRDGQVSLVFRSCGLCLWNDVPEMTGTYSTRAIIPSIGDKMGDTQHLLDHMLADELPQELEEHALREVCRNLAQARTILQHSARDDRARREALHKFLLTRLLRGAVASKHGRRPIIVDQPKPLATASTDPF